MSSHTLPDMQGVPTRLGRYRLHYRIASGGMASVWLARATGANAFEKVVAIKTIHAHMVAEPAAVRMFIDEARIASAINHPNVCHVFDFGEEGGTHYLVMEYLVGESMSRLRKRLASAGAVSGQKHLAALAARIVADAAEGLHAAHELVDEHGASREVVHRDISPQNIFITYEGTVKVVDFGIAKAKSKLEKTRPGEFKGKFEYVAPEQIRDLPIDRRADLWALGVCLWELLTLQRLFKRDDPAAAIAAIALDPIPAPSSVRPGLSPALDRIVLKALERDVEARYQTARELGRALRGFLADSGQVVDAPEVGELMGKLFPEDKAKRIAAREAVLERGEAGTPSSLPSALAISPSPTRDGDRALDLPAPAPRSRRLLAVALVAVALGLGGLAVARRFAPAQDAPQPVVVDEPPTEVEMIEKAVLEAEPPLADPSPELASPQPDAGPLIVAEQAAPPEREPEAPVDAGALVADLPPPPTPGSDAPVDAGAIALVRKHLRKGTAPLNKPVAPPVPVPLQPEPQPRRAVQVGAPPLVGDARAGTGRVKILGAVGQYEVRVDGAVVGKTPLVLDLAVGMHRLDFREPGSRTGPSQQLKVQLGSEYSIEVN